MLWGSRPVANPIVGESQQPRCIARTDFRENISRNCELQLAAHIPFIRRAPTEEEGFCIFFKSGMKYAKDDVIGL